MTDEPYDDEDIPEVAAPDLPTGEQIDRMTAAFSDEGPVMTAIRGLRAEVTRFQHRLKVTTIVGVLAVAVAAILVVLALSLSGDAQRSADDAQDFAVENRARAAEAQYGSCVQTNVATDQRRRTFLVAILVFSPNPDVQAILARDAPVDFDEVRAFLSPTEVQVYDTYRRQVERESPFRECTVEGIATYLQDPPPDPATSTTTVPAPAE